MLVLFIGGQKSGKSKLAEEYTLKLSKKQKPYYIATYDNSYNDSLMKRKIKYHKKQRKDKFKTINEISNLPKVIKKNKTYIVDCISMWIFNNLNLPKKKILKQLKTISQLNTNIIFVLNDVNNGVVPLDKLTRKFVDRTGIVGQYLASLCHEVYDIKFGLSIKLK